MPKPKIYGLQLEENLHFEDQNAYSQYSSISTNKVSILVLIIEDLFTDYFRLIRAKFVALALIKSATFLGHPVGYDIKATS